ncbi:MAG TPA: mechanosensitive ion channel family protein [Burkholderiales bacterium]|nr:mechanosensitive ion channel family protein [Burkholderiales bacterium]
MRLAEWSMQGLEAARQRLEVLGGDLAQGPAELANVIGGLYGALMTGMGVRTFTYLAILLLVGIGIEWLYWSYAYASLRAAQPAPGAEPRQAVRPGLRRFFLRLCGLLLFAAAAIGVSAAFSWPRGVQELVVAATLFVVAVRFAWIVVALVLAPGHPRLRLVPDQAGRAGWLAATAMLVVLLLAFGRFASDLMERLAAAPHAAGALRFATITAACVLLLVAAFAFFGRRSLAPRFPKSFVLALLVLAAYATWLLSPMAGTIGAIAAAVIALLVGLRELVFFFWRDQEDRVAPSIVLSAARFVAVLAGLAVGALVLEAPLASLAATENPLLRLTLRLLGVATLALLTHVVWITLRTAIDQRLSRVPPPGTHRGPDASSRLLTLLPLLRVTAAVLLLVMLVLSSLWALGLEITPLLAGAGIVGIALGFGAQALVRDVIAGIFFLAEDAFRIGEYIESGSSTKGTVERITLRTVALRHHNGPLHFVPYGSLGTVRNTSRDWVVFKFNLPLPIDADSEKIRKLIKNVGEEMLADPEVGHLIMEPLKGKLYRVDPGVKIFRCKFRTAPGDQFDVRALAFRRIEAALGKMGVGFAKYQVMGVA